MVAQRRSSPPIKKPIPRTRWHSTVSPENTTDLPTMRNWTMSTSSISSSFDYSLPSIPEGSSTFEISSDLSPEESMVRDTTSTTSSTDHTTASYIKLCAWPIIIILLSMCFSGAMLFDQGLANHQLAKTIIGAEIFILSPLLLMCLSYFSRPSDRVSPEPTAENGLEMSAMHSRY